ncbi:MAG: hypothetical protein J2P23_11300 [Microlunatus sp.]|nr:hypothetical protein [Microlunatus sp.]
MLGLIVLVGLVLWCATAMIDNGAGSRSAGLIAARMTAIAARMSATISDMNYASRRQTELMIPWSRPADDPADAGD